MTTALDPARPARDAAAAQHRASAFIGDALAALHEVIVRHDMTYDEYDVVKQWLIDVGDAGEWPLFLDVWFESTVERLQAARREGSAGAILGPFYLPDAVLLPTPATLPMRPDEAGDPLVLSGQVRSVRGQGLGGAVVDIWQADAQGLYSGFGAAEAGNLRARVLADDEGRFQITTVLPAPYEIPGGGPCGQLLRATGWNSFRPAHLHVRVSAPGHAPLVSQLFFAGDDYLDVDVAGAVKDELVLDLERTNAGLRACYDFLLPTE